MPIPINMPKPKNNKSNATTFLKDAFTILSFLGLSFELVFSILISSKQMYIVLFKSDFNN